MFLMHAIWHDVTALIQLVQHISSKDADGVQHDQGIQTEVEKGMPSKIL